MSIGVPELVGGRPFRERDGDVGRGTETGDPFWDLEFGFVGDDSRTYDDDCGVVPDELYDVGELYPDGEASANVCLAVPEGAPGLWTVAPQFGEPAFFTAEAR